MGHMGKSAFASLCFSASALVLLACGSTVTYEDDGGGGAGGAPQPSSGPGQTKGPTTVSTKSVSTTGPTTGPTTVQTVGPTTTNQQSSISVVSTGSSMCDSGDCSSCQECSFNGPCSLEAQACSNNPECIDFINCISECFDQACYDECSMQYAGGMDDYYNLAICVICDACYFSCDGQSSGC
jgi:hypothetical protein